MFRIASYLSKRHDLAPDRAIEGAVVAVFGLQKKMLRRVSAIREQIFAELMTAYCEETGISPYSAFDRLGRSLGNPAGDL